MTRTRKKSSKGDAAQSNERQQRSGTPGLPAFDFFQAVLKILPSIRTPLQVVGLALTVGAVIVVQLVSPNNIQAMMSAGTVGIGLIVFATLFVILPLLPRAQRAIFIVVMFLIYVGASIYLVSLTYNFISSGSRQIGEDAYRAITAKLNLRKTQLSQGAQATKTELYEIGVRSAQAQSLIERERLTKLSDLKRAELSTYQIELAGVQSRLKDLADVPRLVSNILAELQKFERELQLQQSASGTEIQAAHADASRGDFDAAQRFIEQRVKSDKQRYARGVFVLGQIAELKGEVTKAIKLYQQASLELPNDALILDHYARILRLTGRFLESVNAYKTALDKSSAAPLAEKLWLQTNYAVALWHAGKIETATAEFKQAYSQAKAGTIQRALVSQNFGAFLWDRGALIEAETSLKEAKDIYDRLSVDRQFLKYETDNNLGGILLSEGRYEESFKLLEAALRNIESTIGKDNLPFAQTTANVVANRTRYGLTSAAAQHAEFLLAKVNSSELTGFELGIILRVLSEYYTQIQDFAQADKLLNESIGILMESSEDGIGQAALAQTILKLVELNIDRGQIMKAKEELLSNALYLERGVRPKTRTAAIFERIKGKIALSESHFDLAIEYLTRSIEVVTPPLKREHPNMVWSYIPLAKAYLAQGDLENGMNFLRLSQRIVEQHLHKENHVSKQISGLLTSVAYKGKI